MPSTRSATNRPGHEPARDHPTSAAEREYTVGLLAAEAFSLVARGCASAVGRRRLTEVAGGDPVLLAAAARRCGDVGDLDRDVQQQAARLLARTADRLRGQPAPGVPGDKEQDAGLLR